MTAAAQMDLFNPTTRLTTVHIPDVGEVVESVGGAWRAAHTRWGWCLYRLTSIGWESWEPPLPFGQPYLNDRLEAESTLEGEIDRYGDAILMLP